MQESRLHYSHLQTLTNAKFSELQINVPCNWSQTISHLFINHTIISSPIPRMTPTLDLSHSSRHWDNPYSIITPLSICPSCMCTVNLCWFTGQSVRKSANMLRCLQKCSALWSQHTFTSMSQLLNEICTLWQLSSRVPAVCRKQAKNDYHSRRGVGKPIAASERKWRQISSMWQKMSNQSQGSDKNHQVNNFSPNKQKQRHKLLITSCQYVPFWAEG